MNRAFVIAAVAASLLHVETSRADLIPDRTMINTLKCEAGKVALKMAAERLPTNRKIIVSWSHANTVKREVGVGANIPGLGLGGSADLSKEELRELKSEGQRFNLHPDNEKEVCQKIKHEIIKEGLGVYDCLFKQKFATLQNSIEQSAGTASCKTKISLAKQLKGNARLQFWGADVGPSGSWGDIEVYDILIAAPDHPKEKSD